MAYNIHFAPGADRDLSQMRVFDHRLVLEPIEQQLSHEPATKTRNRKCLGDHMLANFEYVPPLWELKVGPWRVFYTVDRPSVTVHVHAVRRKPPEMTTAEVLNENDAD